MLYYAMEIAETRARYKVDDGRKRKEERIRAEPKGSF
jgi:hypothetical protein